MKKITPDSFTKEEYKYISKLLYTSLWIWFVIWVIMTSILLVMLYNSDTESTNCTPTQQREQILEKLDSIDMKLDWVGMECADINMNLQDR